MMSEIIKSFNMTGPCEIDIDLLEKKWDHRFWLSQWDTEFRLIKYLRRGSGCTEIKCTISNEQAQEIIQRLKLVSTGSIFRSGASWRKEGQSELDMRPKPKKTVKP
jgi:hypothetical protein